MPEILDSLEDISTCLDVGMTLLAYLQSDLQDMQHSFIGNQHNEDWTYRMQTLLYAAEKGFREGLQIVNEQVEILFKGMEENEPNSVTAHS